MPEENYSDHILKEFRRITSLDYKAIPSHLPEGRIPIGFFCPYVPEELLHAAGAFPFRLLGSPIKLSHAPAHLPPGCCHFMKSSLESLLSGELDFLKGVVFSHTCDGMQGLSDIWAFQKRLPLLFNFMVPTNLCSESTRPYLKSEIERFWSFLGSNVGTVTIPNLLASVRLFNRIREKIGELYQLKRTSSSRLSEGDFASVIRAGYWMDRNQYLQSLSELLNAMPRKPTDETPFVPIYLTGNMVHSAPYFSLIHEAGARVVSDDLCSGERFLRLRTREDIDPIEALTERYLTSFLCPTKHKGTHARLETLLPEIEQSGAKGVIFLQYKYCEPHFFDHPDLKTALEAKGIPSLLLEVDDPSTSQGQMKMRIQAFVEMLSAL